MMEGSAELRFEGCNFFRQRICFSLLSGRPLTIVHIRSLDENPGVQEHETKLLDLLNEITNGTNVTINKTGTQVRFEPGMLNGGNVEFDCGASRCLSYFLEPLVLLAPFCGRPVEVKLRGVTNDYRELSVDAIRACWLPVFNKFILDDEALAIKINARGFSTEGGGEVVFTSPVVKKLRPVKRLNPGKVRKIRGLAYVCRVSPSFAHRMVDAAKKMLRGFISDVYITVDQRKGPQSGKSPGFGIFLTAETTEGIFYHGEAMSKPAGTTDEPATAEEVGVEAAQKLLSEIYQGGCCDTTAQPLAATFMALGDRDISKFLFGQQSLQTKYILEDLRTFFEHNFKVDKMKNIEDESLLREIGPGSTDKAIFTCLGVGFLNLNKGVFLSTGAALISAAGGIIGGYRYVKCKFVECCDDTWIYTNASSNLHQLLDDKLYGQHLAKDIITRSIAAHMQNKKPKKALVLSLHGWTGAGKNYVSSILGKSLYHQGPESQYMHLFVSTLHFPHPEEVSKYQRKIREWIVGNITNCERSLFIFDEVDKLPVQVMDAVRPFIDFYERIGTVDPRKSIFLFLSNAGGTDIAKQALKHHQNGLPREQLGHRDLQELIQNCAYNEGEGGLKKSELVARHLIDVFVPFLPLERKHVRMCVEDYMQENGYHITDERVEAIVNEMVFFPRDNPLFSTSGCKSVAQKADFFYAHEKDQLHGSEDDL
ncbi:putative RNA 3'-terminal phosphate cyclase-like protein [Aphelenchoides besseyi]|nr:putative RNA 3'-terminal phosphate cyclase-like protein [Aphelenchoides besseyi]KAI6221665.1 putative RNA 3'-terminal phosphate cyclase-like protein [Aphelenchoides besseyi]